MTRLLAIILLFTTAAAQARLGETADQLKARYGEGRTTIVRIPEGATMFATQKSGILISCILWQGTCQWIMFEKREGTFTREERDTLIQANHTGPWKRTDSTDSVVLFESTDGKVQLLVRGGKTIQLSTIAYETTAKEEKAKAEAERQKRQAEHKAKVDELRRQAEEEKNGDLSGF